MLDNKLKNNPFELPSGYFNALPTQIQSKCVKTEKHSVFSFKPKWAIAGVAGVALLLTGLNVYNSDTQAVSSAQFQSVFKSYPFRQAKNASFVKHQPNEAIINRLALENVSIDDILLARY